MGGEYLPGYLPGEVEIARIALQSTTSDVISLRAYPVPGGIAYRVVDEYEAEFELPIPKSEKPLTLTELIRQLDEGEIEGSDYSGGLSLGFNESNADGGDARGCATSRPSRRTSTRNWRSTTRRYSRSGRRKESRSRATARAEVSDERHQHLRKTLDRLPRCAAINTLHQALMQLNAIERGAENGDYRPAMAEIRGLLRMAGHIGFADGPSS